MNMNADADVNADADDAAQTTPETAEIVNRKYMIREDGRIVALRGFGSVYEGAVGGFVESESNLSHDGTCWVFDDARVRGNARVMGNAHVRDSVIIYGNAVVKDNACVYNNARVYERATVADHAYICGHANVHGDARVYDHATVAGRAAVCDSGQVYGGAHIEVVYVSDNARVCGNAYITARVDIAKDAVVTRDDDVIALSGVSPWNITVYRTYDGFRVQAGCQNFTADELEYVAEDHGFTMANWQKMLWSAILERTKAWHADGRGKSSTGSAEQ